MDTRLKKTEKLLRTESKGMALGYTREFEVCLLCGSLDSSGLETGYAGSVYEQLGQALTCRAVPKVPSWKEDGDEYQYDDRYFCQDCQDLREGARGVYDQFERIMGLISVGELEELRSKLVPVEEVEKLEEEKGNEEK